VDYVWALKDVSFEVKRGEVLGIIGRNGAGKSTLLKILSRITAPTTGQVKVKGRIASLLEVGTGMHPELTGRENIYLNGAILGMTKAEITGKLDEIISFSGVERFIDTPVKRYSSGMMVRLGFAVAAHLEPEILIVDEVLAVGDAEFQKKCIGKMQDVAGHGRTVLFVSHNMQAVRQLTQRCILLEDGALHSDGLPSDVTAAYCSTAAYGDDGGCNTSVRGIRCRSRESPDARVSFVSASVLAPQDGRIPVGGSVVVDAFLACPVGMASVCFGYALTDRFGANVLTGWSDSFAIPSAGSHFRRLHLDGLWVAPGSYSLVLSACSRSVLGVFHAYDVLQGIAEVRVEPELITGEGVASWPGQWGAYVHRQNSTEIGLADSVCRDPSPIGESRKGMSR
jgi:ABC-type polysaccharide/polyol phosphate transport system ATPase subunit